MNAAADNKPQLHPSPSPSIDEHDKNEQQSPSPSTVGPSPQQPKLVREINRRGL